MNEEHLLNIIQNNVNCKLRSITSTNKTQAVDLPYKLTVYDHLMSVSTASDKKNFKSRLHRDFFPRVSMTEQ